MARRTILRSDLLAGLGATTLAAGITPLTPINPGGSSPYQPQITPSIIFGLVAPFSGDARPIGLRLQAGVQAAMDSANQLAGTLSRTFALRTFDDQNRVANALLQASFATGDTSIIATIGHVSSEATLQAIPTYGAASMPLIVPLCTDDRITATQWHCVFRLPTKDTFEGNIFARSVIADPKPKLPYVFVQDADYGADVANGFIDVMNEQKVPVKYRQFPYSGADFGKVVDAALATPFDYAFLAGVVGDMGPIVGVLRAKGYAGPIGASQGFFDPGTAKLGSVANGMTISTSMPYLPFAPSTVRARAEFEAHYGGLDSFAAFGYAAAQLLVAAVQRSGATARNTLVRAIAQGVPIDTMVGTYSFNPFGDALQPQLYYYTVRDGKFSYLRQAHPSAFMIK